MPLLPDIFGEGVMFFGCPLVVCPDRSCYHDISWMAWAVGWNVQGI